MRFSRRGVLGALGAAALPVLAFGVVRAARAPLTMETLWPYLSLGARRATENVCQAHLRQTVHKRSQGWVRCVSPAVYLVTTIYTPDRSGELPVSFHQEWARMLNRLAANYQWEAVAFAPLITAQLADADTAVYPADFSLPPDRWAEFRRPRRAVLTPVFFNALAPAVQQWRDNPYDVDSRFDLSMSWHENLRRQEAFLGLKDVCSLREGELPQKAVELSTFRAVV